MGITGTGIILFGLGFILFIFSRKWLYIATIFFIPFTATAMVNFSSGFWLSPFHFFGLLWIAREFSHIITTGTLELPPHRGSSLLLLFVFVAIVFLSTSMPLIHDSETYIHSPRLNEPGSIPLHFTSRNLTTPFYILFGALVSTMVVSRNKTNADLLLTVKTYVIAGVVCSFWGWLQFSFRVLNIPYPASIFNNSANDISKGYNQVLGGSGFQLDRVSSVAVEPSIFAQFLLTVIPFILVAILIRQKILSPRADKLLVMVMLLILVLSTSGSAYLGLAALILIIFILLFIMNRLHIWHLLGFLTAIISAIIVYTAVPKIREFLDIFIFSKLETGSGQERLLTIQYARDYFMDYPILGLGWGSVTSHDLIMNILANAGVLGLSAFSAMIIYVLFRLNRLLGEKGKYNIDSSRNTDHMAIGTVAALIVLLFLQFLTGFSYGFGHFWFILGVAIATYSITPQTHFRENSR